MAGDTGDIENPVFHEFVQWRQWFLACEPLISCFLLLTLTLFPGNPAGLKYPCTGFGGNWISVLDSLSKWVYLSHLFFQPECKFPREMVHLPCFLSNCQCGVQTSSSLLPWSLTVTRAQKSKILQCPFVFLCLLTLNQSSHPVDWWLQSSAWI